MLSLLFSMSDVIQLDSDDDDDIMLNDVKKKISASASVSIVNSTPLDLSRALGLNDGNGQIRSPAPIDRDRFAELTRAAAVRQVISNSAPLQRMQDKEYKISTMSTPNNQIQNTRNTSSKAIEPPPGLTLPSYVSNDRITNYTFECNGEREGDIDRSDIPNLKFKCSFDNCRRILHGNVSFVSHLWAHVAIWKDTDSEKTERNGEKIERSERRSDDHLISTCPQCLTLFHSPYLLQVHYSRCHSRQPEAVSKTTCAICERDICSKPQGMTPAMAMKKHLEDYHAHNDAPYHCRRCRYRTTVRLHLFDHFVREHTNTNFLMCPFCLHSETIPAYQRKRAFVMATSFVKHMEQHDLKSRLSCDLCALTFVSNADRAKHRQRDHCPTNPKWKITQRDAETRSRAKSRIVHIGQSTKAGCEECIKSCQLGLFMCINCITQCYDKSPGGDYVLMKKLGTARITSSKIHKPKARYECKCGMKTFDGKRIAYHYYYCRKALQMVHYDPPNKNILITEKDKEDEAKEVEMFAVIPKRTLAEIDRDANNMMGGSHKKRKIQSRPLFEYDISHLNESDDITATDLYLLRARVQSIDPKQSLKEYDEMCQLIEEANKEEE